MSNKIYSNDYMSLFDDGTIGISDGVGYIDTLDIDEAKKLYNALKEYLESKREESEG